MKSAFFFFLFMFGLVSASAQTLTFEGTQRGVYNNRMYLINYSTKHPSRAVITKDSITFQDSTQRVKYDVKTIRSATKRGHVVYSYLCNQNTIVVLDIHQNYLTIQRPDTVRVYSGNGVINTKFSRYK